MIDYIEDYEARMREYEKNFDTPLQRKLQSKREFGLKKYGDISFQSSKENLDKAHCLEHLLEELIDAINYTNTSRVKLQLRNSDEAYYSSFSVRLSMTVERLEQMYTQVLTLQHELQSVGEKPL